MRPAGGYTPDLFDYAYEVDVYKIWADMVAFDRCTLPLNRPHHYCAFCGRRDGKVFVLSHKAVMAKYGPLHQNARPHSRCAVRRHGQPDVRGQL